MCFQIPLLDGDIAELVAFQVIVAAVRDVAGSGATQDFVEGDVQEEAQVEVSVDGRAEEQDAFHEHNGLDVICTLRKRTIIKLLMFDLQVGRAYTLCQTASLIEEQRFNACFPSYQSGYQAGSLLSSNGATNLGPG